MGRDDAVMPKETLPDALGFLRVPRFCPPRQCATYLRHGASPGVPIGGGPRRPTWRQAVGVVLYRPHLRRTVAIALVVGTVLFCINQLDVVLRGDATAVVWIKAAVTYLVPFAISNVGVLVASCVDGAASG
jgi:hypothetical protein